MGTILPKWVIVVAVVCSVLFFLLATDVRFRGLTARLDPKVSKNLHDLGSHKNNFLQGATQLGLGEKGLWVMALALVLIRRWHYIPLLWLAVSFGVHINVEMQRFFGRARPRFSDMPILTNPGFPSGHTAEATLFFGFLIILAACEISTRYLKTIAISLALFCILLISFSRVALLVHHMSDVVAANLWCTAWLIGCYYTNVVAYRWSKENLEQWAEKPIAN